MALQRQLKDLQALPEVWFMYTRPPRLVTGGVCIMRGIKD